MIEILYKMVTVLLILSSLMVVFSYNSIYAVLFLILTGLFKVSNCAGFFSATSMILSGCYSLWLFNRVAYGNLKIQYWKKMCDINKMEFFALFPLLLPTLVVGLQPNIFLNSMHISANKLIELI